MTLSPRLQAAIRDPHERIEALPLAQAMASGTVGRPAYLLLLEQLRQVHSALEARLERAEGLDALYDPDAMARTGDLDDDLAALGATPGGGETLPATRRFLHLLSDLAASPAALVGCLYVLEGSRMGSMVLAPRLAGALGVEALPGRGLDYHVRGIRRRVADWRAFKATLEALPAAADRPDAVVGAAGLTMSALFDIYRAVGEAEAELPLAVGATP